MTSRDRGDVGIRTASVTEDQPAIGPVLDGIGRIEAAVRETLEALQDLDGRRVVAEEGMALETALRVLSSAGGTDLAALQAAASALERLPALDVLHRRGVLSWARVRQLSFDTRRFDVGQRELLDRWLETHADRLARADDDQQADLFDHVVRELSPLRSLRDRAERREVCDRLVLQLQLDGSSESYGTWSPKSTAILADALHTEADAPMAPPCRSPDPDGSATDSEPVEEVVRPRSGQLADALLRLVTRGRGRAPTPTPPTRFTVVVDADRASDANAGQLRTGLPGADPPLVDRTVELSECGSERFRAGARDRSRGRPGRRRGGSRATRPA